MLELFQIPKAKVKNISTCFATFFLVLYGSAMNHPPCDTKVLFLRKNSWVNQVSEKR